MMFLRKDIAVQCDEYDWDNIPIIILDVSIKTFFLFHTCDTSLIILETLGNEP